MKPSVTDCLLCGPELAASCQLCNPLRKGANV